MNTHEVLNQPPPLVNVNLFNADKVLREALVREGGAWGERQALEFGKIAGSAEVQTWAEQANQIPPTLHSHDRFGNRLDEVVFHPAWHHLMRTSLAYGLHNLPWVKPGPGAQVVRAATYIMMGQSEAGHMCPVTMTFAAVPTLRLQPEIAREWQPKITSAVYDPSFAPVTQKQGATIGMAMTERQGGSDVRANTTRAEPVGKGGPGGEYLLTGHKWFCSAPMCDAFLVLAQASRGLSCFFMPRWLPSGEKNRIFIQRLKDKLGNRSNASSEIELEGAWARMVGEEGRGVPTIIQMVNHTRLDCVIGSTALMREGLRQAVHHCRHRAAFGKDLIAQPLMQNVLADLGLEVEAAITLMMRLARAYDEAGASREKDAFRRIATAVSKYWVCKRTPVMVGEALECLGGNGYVEASGLPRLYREAPLNSIWEGSGNVNCLDVLRAIEREKGTREAFFAELKTAQGGDRLLDTFVTRLNDGLVKEVAEESRARALVSQMALALQATLLVRHAPPAVADAFCASRLAGNFGLGFGTLPVGSDVAGIIDRFY